MGLDGLLRLQSEIERKGLRIQGPSYIFVGDRVTPSANTTREGRVVIPLGTHLRVEEILVRSQDGAALGFEKRIILEGFHEEFSPNKFKKI